MGYLLTQMAIYLIIAFLLGLLLGWLFWRYGREAETVDTSGLEAELKALRTERETLTGQVTGLQNDLRKCHQRCRELEVAPVEAPVEIPAPSAVAAVAVAPAEADAGTKPTGLDGPRNGAPDDLKIIKGIGPKLEKMLHGMGFYHFDQIANWTDAEVSWVDQNLEGFFGRVTRDRWIEQARELVR